MYNISETWKILVLIFIPAKYLKDVFGLSDLIKEPEFISHPQASLIVTAF